jgi:hypothetical protein
MWLKHGNRRFRGVFRGGKDFFNPPNCPWPLVRSTDPQILNKMSRIHNSGSKQKVNTYIGRAPVAVTVTQQ